MRIIIVTIFFLFFLTHETVAQFSCKITYTYDAGGNRIQRAYNCDSPPNPWDNPVRPDHTLLTTLGPNPTFGGLTGTFSEPVSSASVQVIDMSGAVVLSQSITQQTSVLSLDISAAVPGTYMVTIWALGIVESYTVIKM